MKVGSRRHKSRGMGWRLIFIYFLPVAASWKPRRILTFVSGITMDDALAGPQFDGSTSQVQWSVDKEAHKLLLLHGMYRLM